jgi:ribosomal protein S18 acetylase RimI-like enzyme
MPQPSGLSAADPAVLDDVVWAALTGPQAHLAHPASGADDVKRYDPDVAPFGSARGLDARSLAAAVARLAAGQPLAFVTPAPLAAVNGADVMMRASLLQMVLTDPASLASSVTAAIEKLATANVPEMMQLVQATRPGPFGPRTIEMGDYVGIRAAGRLVAMTGERMKVPGFTEVSAVCVDPAFRGQGHAAALIRHVAAAILARGETPFLHVVQDNHAAVALYEKLGFSTRRELQFAVFRRGEA